MCNNLLALFVVILKQRLRKRFVLIQNCFLYYIPNYINYKKKSKFRAKCEKKHEENVVEFA